MRSVFPRGEVVSRLREALAGESAANGLRPIELAACVADCYPGMPLSQVGMRVGQVLSRMFRRGQVIRGPHHLTVSGRVVGVRYYLARLTPGS